MNEPVAPIPQQPAPQKKDNTWKWLLLGCFGFIVLFGATGGLVAYRTYKSFNMTPAQVEVVAQEILPFEKPEDFEGKFSMNIMGIKMATLGQKGNIQNAGMIMVVTMPGGKNNRDALRKSMHDNMDRQNAGNNVNQEKQPPQTFKVRGQTVPAEVQKLTSTQGGGATMLSYMLYVDSPKGELVLLTVQGPEATATHDWVQKFLDTVK